MPMMKTLDFLRQQLGRIDGKGYKAYKDIQGSYHGADIELHVDHVQGDPFAAPSRVRVALPQSLAGFAADWYATEFRRVALEDFLTREVAAAIEALRFGDRTNTGGSGGAFGAGGGERIGGTGNSGLVAVDRPGQEVLPRTAVKVDQQCVEVRLSVGLPAAGRRVLGQQAVRLLCELVPRVVKKAVLDFSRDKMRKHLELADQQEAIRRYLAEHDLVAFVANGAILPRESGVSNRPLRGQAVIPFQSPPSLEIAIPVPHREPIRGMGIPRGITLIVGGGYHGKSTLLKAIERGVYNHIPGDGREYVITDHTACKVRAEDGRRVEKVNISPFIATLPFAQETACFSTDDASGSTSQAANIIEALEAGSKLLLVDEDTSATNFMIRDARMQKLVAKEKEPITPFVDKVKSLYDDFGVSTILVIGGTGDYFDVADTVLMMDEYRAREVTAQAKAIAADIANLRQREASGTFGEIRQRVVLPESFRVPFSRKDKISAKGLHTIVFGSTQIELSFLEQLVDQSQTRAIADIILFMYKKRIFDGNTTLSAALDRVYEQIKEKGLEVVSPFYGQHPGDLALPRRWEVAAAINRLRTLEVK